MSATISIDPMLLLEAKLVRAIQDKIAKGWSIDSDTFHDSNRCICCALGSVVQQDLKVAYYELAGDALNIPASAASKVEDGFMGLVYSADGKDPFVQLGLKLRDQFIK